MTVQEYFEDQVVRCREKIEKYEGFLRDMAGEVASLESDHVWAYGGWLTLKDTSHKGLGARLATMTNQSLRFRTSGMLRTATFRDVGPFYKVDLDRPNPKCRKVRVLQLPKELEMEICGDLPEGYTLLEELDGVTHPGN